MQAIKQYETVRHFDVDKLVAAVNDAILKGWQPYGAQNVTLVFVDYTNNFDRDGAPRLLYSQALVKYQ